VDASHYFRPSFPPPSCPFSRAGLDCHPMSPRFRCDSSLKELDCGNIEGAVHPLDVAADPIMIPKNLLNLHSFLHIN
jgi:hypothetical protein